MVHGVIFCYQDDNNFYRVLIDTEGYYYIYKNFSGNRTTIQTKKSSSALKPGYNALNTINVTRDTESQFTIKFNDNPEVIIFTDDTGTTPLTGGRCGFYVAVGDETQEQFPNTPVDVRFKQILPTGASI